MKKKKKQLQKHKFLATSLFVLMGLIYLLMLYLQQRINTNWIGYIKAFSEAAMVGALADWFAVTALFKHPLGIKIPHTNLISNNKNTLGENLGLFVSENFLNSKTIRPYVTKIDLSTFIIDWLSKENNLIKTKKEINNILKSILLKIDNQEISNLISKKIKEISYDINLSDLASKGLFYAIENNEHQRLISLLIPSAKHYVENNKVVIYDKVVEKNPILGLIGGKAVTNQLISGILSFLEEIENNSNHSIRNDITSKLYEISSSFKTDEIWKKRFDNLKQNLITDENIENYTLKVWIETKESLLSNLEDENSTLNKYLEKYLIEIQNNIAQNENTRNKINKTIHKFVYKLALKNSKEIGNIISNTVKDWEGREISNKLELEVGKDLQFIRINGTLVGGLVGLVIYFLSQYII
nr:DUF445 domain-containing protein [uncultured Flavobacterium sp.]